MTFRMLFHLRNTGDSHARMAQTRTNANRIPYFFSTRLTSTLIPTAPSRWSGGGAVSGGALLVQPERVAHHLLVGGLAARELPHDATVPDDRDPIGGNHDDAGSPGGKLLHEAVDLDLRANVDAAGGLIEDVDVAVANEPLREHDLLLVPAGQVPHQLAERGRLHADGVRHLRDERRDLAPPDEPGGGVEVQDREGHVVEHRQSEDETLLLPLLGDEGDAPVHRVAGGPDAHLPPVHEDPAGVSPPGAVDELHDLGAAGADETDQPEDLAPPQREGHVGAHAALREPLNSEDLLARLHALLRVLLSERAAHHLTDDLVDGDPFHGRGDDAAAVAEHGDAVCHLLDLLQPVGDVDHRHAAPPQATDHLEEAVHLAAGERGGRLVHDQDVRPEREGLRDLDHLLVRGTEGVHPHARVERQPEGLEELLDFRPHPLPVDEPPRPARLASQEDVLGDREVRHQVELLVDDAHTRVDHGARAGAAHLLAAQPDLALVRAVDSGQDLHERGLPGPVLTRQRVDFRRVQVEVDAVERADAGEALADAAHPEQSFRHRPSPAPGNRRVGAAGTLPGGIDPGLTVKPGRYGAFVTGAGLM